MSLDELYCRDADGKFAKLPKRARHFEQFHHALIDLGFFSAFGEVGRTLFCFYFVLRRHVWKDPKNGKQVLRGELKKGYLSVCLSRDVIARDCGFGDDGLRRNVKETVTGRRRTAAVEMVTRYARLAENLGWLTPVRVDSSTTIYRLGTCKVQQTNKGPRVADIEWYLDAWLCSIYDRYSTVPSSPADSATDPADDPGDAVDGAVVEDEDGAATESGDDEPRSLASIRRLPIEARVAILLLNGGAREVDGLRAVPTEMVPRRWRAAFEYWSASVRKRQAERSGAPQPVPMAEGA